jgi:NAD(P)-dependent dehydrogenase (short-subunit alcohol dehydrogenase family)
VLHRLRERAPSNAGKARRLSVPCSSALLALYKRGIAGHHRGNVISITVTWVRNGSPYVVPSAMSKSAIHAMTMALATEWGRYGIRLNTIAPGEIPTEG